VSISARPPVWLRGLVFVYLGLLIAGPVALVVLNAFADGVAFLSPVISLAGFAAFAIYWILPKGGAVDAPEA